MFEKSLGDTSAHFRGSINSTNAEWFQNSAPQPYEWFVHWSKSVVFRIFHVCYHSLNQTNVQTNKHKTRGITRYQKLELKCFTLIIKNNAVLHILLCTLHLCGPRRWLIWFGEWRQVEPILVYFKFLLIIIVFSLPSSIRWLWFELLTKKFCNYINLGANSMTTLYVLNFLPEADQFRRKLYFRRATSMFCYFFFIYFIFLNDQDCVDFRCCCEDDSDE